MRRLGLIWILLGAAAGHGHAQHIYQRVALHYINDSVNTRPAGPFADPDTFSAALDSANVFLDRMGYGYRFTFVGADDVYGASVYYDLTQNEFDNFLQESAQGAVAQYHWRTDALNVYGVNSAFTGGASRVPNYTAANADVMQIVTNQQTFYWNQLVVHEIGHHNALWHTFETGGLGFTGPCVADDCVADTRLSPELSCVSAFSCNSGGSAECCCPTKISLLNQRRIDQGWTQLEFDDLRWNVMSYFGAMDCTDMGAQLTFRDMRMSQGQAERWADATRRYHAGEVTGFTYFVNKYVSVSGPDGYSDKPYQTVAAGYTAATSAGSTHIVNIRAGTYPENLTFSSPATLRSNRGAVTIGL